MRVMYLALALLAGSSAAQADSWGVAPAHYVYKPIARCSDGAAATLKPNEARYEICADQFVLFNAAVDKARAENRLLIIDFGATWCPWCKSLQAQWTTAELLGNKNGSLDLGATFNVVEIGISTLHAGRMTEIPSGHAVLDHVLTSTGTAKLKSVPFLAVIDPQNHQEVVARGLDDFEQPRSGRHDPQLIRAFLEQAHAHMRKGAPAPSEPGWLRRKITRVWMRLLGE
jgi:thiol-disulfide isomerase/thioredoxin